MSQRKTATRSRSSGSPTRTHNPFDRLKVALQTGVLKATWGTRRNGDFEEIPTGYWLREFDDEADQKRRIAMRLSKRKQAETDARLASNSPWTKKITQAEFPDSTKLDLFDLPDLSLVEPTELPLPIGDAGNALRPAVLTGDTKFSSDGSRKQDAEDVHQEDPEKFLY